MEVVASSEVEVAHRQVAYRQLHFLLSGMCSWDMQTVQLPTHIFLIEKINHTVPTVTVPHVHM